MGDCGEVLIAFWDGKSKGTNGMIEYAASKMPVFVFVYKDTLKSIKPIKNVTYLDWDEIYGK